VNRLVAPLLLALGVLAGCGIPPTEPISFGEPPKAAPTGDQLYFLFHGKLYPTLRSDDPSPDPASTPAPVRRIVTDDPAANAVNLLAAGPLPADREAGLTSEVPTEVIAFTSSRHDGDDQQIDVVLRSSPAGLSDVAVTQIACTAIAAATSRSAPVERIALGTKRGPERGPVTCPLLAPSPRDP
jgi:hypothetical protein